MFTRLRLATRILLSRRRHPIVTRTAPSGEGTVLDHADFHTIARAVADREQGKHGVNIADVNELMRAVNQVYAELFRQNPAWLAQYLKDHR